MPPYLAGRNSEVDVFKSMLQQDIILDNMVLTGLRGVGKTVLLETLKPIAIQNGWAWIGTELSESASLSEENMAIRLLTDLSVMTSGIVVGKQAPHAIGFTDISGTQNITLNYHLLQDIFVRTPGLASDKIKRVLQVVSESIAPLRKKGIIFAYDEAQNLSDRDQKGQYPLSMLLDVFQSIQRSNIPFMLVLSGLPTLFPKLVEARTFAERMFRVVFLDRLNDNDSRDAILKPIAYDNCPIRLTDDSVQSILSISKGYPYFIQFICREAFDAFIQNMDQKDTAAIPVTEILRKLDSDFFAGRWARVTDRQRDLLTVIARLDNASTEFTVQEIVDLSKNMAKKPFSNSHVNQMLLSLIHSGIIYKNRYGKYSFAVPLIDEFILRQAV